MSFSHPYRLCVAIAACALLVPSGAAIRAQGTAEKARELRCVFPLNATGAWNKDGTPVASTKPASLIVRFDAINPDEGTAELKNGTVGSGVTVQLAGGNLHFIQAFRTGPIYLTTVFNKETTAGKFKAVHSRHEFFNVPLDGATSSPEQYYGECEALK